MTAAIGRAPSWPDFTADDLSAFIAQMQQAQADAGGLNPTSPALPRAAGEIDPTGRGTGPIDQRRQPQFAGNEGQVQGLERAMASPQDLAALGAPQGSPDALLYDRTGMGGGANAFQGSAGPSGSRMVPLPPARPDASALLMPAPDPATTGGVSGMNPGAGGGPQRQIVAASRAVAVPGTGTTAPVGTTPDGTLPANAFDPLTGQVTSGSPTPLGGRSGPPAAAGQPGGQPDILQRFFSGIGQGNPDLSNLLMHISAGLLSGNRGIGAGIGAGLSSYQAGRAGNLKEQLQAYQLQQQMAGQQAQRNYLIKNKGLSPEAADAFIANPTLLSNQLAQEKPNYQTIGGQIYDLSKNGGVPGQANLIGSAGLPLEQEVRKADALATVADNHREDKTITPLADPAARLAAGIPDYDNRPAWRDANGKVSFDDGPTPRLNTNRNADGSSTTREYDPATRSFREVPGGGASGVDTTGVPPGVDPRTYRVEAAKAAVAEGKAADQRALQAQSAIPILDRAQAAYERLAQNGGIGPVSASQPSRMVAGALGRQNEVDRQEFEAAAKQLELLQAQISMKGQGAITEGERRILAMTLPRLDAASPETGLTTLKAMREQFGKAIAAPGLPASSTREQGPAPTLAAPPSGAVQALQQDPSLAAQFDAKYGRGASSRILGGR